MIQGMHLELADGELVPFFAIGGRNGTIQWGAGEPAIFVDNILFSFNDNHYFVHARGMGFDMTIPLDAAIASGQFRISYQVVVGIVATAQAVIE